MHNLASISKHNHGVEGSETEDNSLLQCFAGQFSQSQLSAVNLRLRWVVVMYTMNNHTTRCESVTAGLTKYCI